MVRIISFWSQLQRQIQQLERTRETVDNSITYLKEVQKQLSDTLKAFNAAECSADNIINGIVAQICKVEHTRFTANLDEASVSQVQETNRLAIDNEKEVLEAHLKKQADMWNDQSYKMLNILSRNEGVWMSSKLFYIVASISLLSMFTIVLYISFCVL